MSTNFSPICTADTFLENLHNFLLVNTKFDDQCKVVYLLVNIRKILERDDKLTNYPALTFYSNWIVHEKISRKSSTELLTSLISPNLVINKPNKVILNNIKVCLNDILKLKKLKLELESFSKYIKFPINLSAKNWKIFIELLLKEIKSSPIEFELAQPVKMKIKVEEKNGYRYTFYINGKSPGSIKIEMKLK